MERENVHKMKTQTMREKGVGATHCKQKNNQRGMWQCIINKKKMHSLNPNLKKSKPWEKNKNLGGARFTQVCRSNGYLLLGHLNLNLVIRWVLYIYIFGY
jgi:hypothetical protein